MNSTKLSSDTATNHIHPQVIVAKRVNWTAAPTSQMTKSARHDASYPRQCLQEGHDVEGVDIAGPPKTRFSSKEPSRVGWGGRLQGGN